jgi:2-amino-4-hydroxy-6-hydroxymethyldihydropteridine diphosphokinase
VYVSIGSNIDRHINVFAGLRALTQRYGPLSLSPIYETEAEGFLGDPFYNLVAGFETDESPEAVNQYLKAVEDMQDRDRSGAKFSSRTLDIDLLLYDDLQLNEPGLKLPRDEIFRYAFVLQPLAELIPDEVCPGREETIAELWEELQCRHRLTPARVVDWHPQGML